MSSYLTYSYLHLALTLTRQSYIIRIFILLRIGPFVSVSNKINIIWNIYQMLMLGLTLLKLCLACLGKEKDGLMEAFLLSKRLLVWYGRAIIYKRSLFYWFSWRICGSWTKWHTLLLLCFYLPFTLQCLPFSPIFWFPF